jgi:O-antigen ligase
LLPKVIFSIPDILKFGKIKLLIIILSLITIQVILVTLVSKAPFEQQLFGRTGRGLGIITEISLLIIVLASAIFVTQKNIRLLLIGVSASALISSLYSIFQSFGIDFLQWESKTNGVIGTLGNPNFQSSFAALALIPTIVIFWTYKYRFIGSIFFSLLLLFTVYRTQSTQGYVSVLAALLFFAIAIAIKKSKSITLILLITTIILGVTAILGMLNKGPFNQYLYKISVQSRGDFWRSAFATANDHPFFGVGIDSFGDWYLKYRDLIAISHPWAEYTDNAHNYFLNYAATAGYPMLLLQLSLISLTIVCIISVLKKIKQNSLELSALFVTWIVFQLQSFISPGNIPLMVWNSVITGSIVGISVLNSNELDELISTKRQVESNSKAISFLCMLFAAIIIYPLYNTDRLQLKAMLTGNGDLAIVAAKQYPESVLRYQIITRELLKSNLPGPALDLARSAVKFNPYSANLWALVAINPAAPVEERLAAKGEILKLDPLNKEVKEFVIK